MPTEEQKQETTEQSPAKPAKETVTVEKSTLDNILTIVKDQAKALETQQKEIEALKEAGGGPKIAKKVKEHTCVLRKYDGQIVKDFASEIYNEYDEKRKEFVLYVDLMLYNDKIVKKVKYLDFISNAERVNAKIVKREKLDEISTIDGITRKTEPDGDWANRPTDEFVEVESIVDKYGFQVEYEGEILNLGEIAINL